MNKRYFIFLAQNSKYALKYQDQYISTVPSVPFHQQIKNVMVSFLLKLSVFWFPAEASLIRAVVISLLKILTYEK